MSEKMRERAGREQVVYGHCILLHMHAGAGSTHYADTSELEDRYEKSLSHTGSA